MPTVKKKERMVRNLRLKSVHKKKCNYTDEYHYPNKNRYQKAGLAQDYYHLDLYPNLVRLRN